MKMSDKIKIPAKLNKLKTIIKKVFVFIMILFFFAFGYSLIQYILGISTPRLNAFNISFSPDGKIITASPTVFFWRLNDGKTIDYSSSDLKTAISDSKTKFSSLSFHTSIVFSPDSNYYILSPDTNIIYLFQYNDGKLIDSFNGIKGFFSDDGKSIIIIRRCERWLLEVVEWNIDEKKTDRIIGKITDKRAIRYINKFYLKPIKDENNKSYVVFACEYDKSYYDSGKMGSVQIWDLEESRCVLCYDIKYDIKEEDFDFIYNIYNIYISNNLVFVDRYHKIITIDINKKEPVAETPKKITRIYRAISPDGKKAAAFGRSNTIIIIDIENQEKIVSMDRRGFDFIRSMEFSPDGRYLAAGSIFRIERGFINVNRVNGSIRLYDTKTGKMIRELKPPFDVVRFFKAFVDVFSSLI